MSNVTTLPAQPRGVIATMAERYEMDSRAFEATIRATCMPKGNNQRDATREEFAAFLLVAKEYGLNPLTKEIYAFPAKGGGIVPVVGIDGWVNLVNSHPQMDGMEFEALEDGKGNLEGMTCKIFRKDRSRPTVVTEFYEECKRDTDPWKMKRRMMRHKSLIQCARYAFGFSNLYDEDEARDIAGIAPLQPVSSGPPPAPPVIIDATDVSRLPERDVRDDLASTNSEIVEEQSPSTTDAAAGDPPSPQPAAASTQIDDEIPDWEKVTEEIVEHYGSVASLSDVQDVAKLYEEEFTLLNRRQQETVEHARQMAMQRLTPPPAPKDPPKVEAPPATPPSPPEAIPEDPKTPDEYEAWWKDFLAKATRSVDVNARWTNDTDKRDNLNPPPTQEQRKHWRVLKDTRASDLRLAAEKAANNA